MKEKIQSLLAKHPSLYKQLLALKGRGNRNLDKICFLTLISQSDTALDVGANLGYYTLLFSQIVGNKGQVHAFEPVPVTFAKLARLIGQSASCENVQLNNLALGESTLNKNIFVKGNDFGQASFAGDQSLFEIETNMMSYEIVQTTLDSYVNDKKLDRLDFIKIDIEGYELMCLKGATQALSTFAPLLYLEIYNAWSSKFGYGPPDIVSFLMSKGYNEFYLVYDGVRKLVNAEDELSPQIFDRPANLICAMSSKHERQVKQLPL